MLLLSLSVVAIGRSAQHLHIEQGFYAVVAQVLPVFLLIVAVEGRFFRGHTRRSHTAAVTTEMLLYLAMMGEAFALAAVARGHDSELLRGGVLTALLVVGLTFIVIAVDGPVKAPSEDDDKPSSSP